MDLKIVIITDLRPGKVDLNSLTAELEAVIESHFEFVCRSINYYDQPIDIRNKPTTSEKTS